MDRPRNPVYALILIILTLAVACGGGSGDGDDGSPTEPSGVTLGIEDITVPAVATQARFSVVLSESSDEEISVDYETADLSAFAGHDYRYTTGRLWLAPGETAGEITVEVLRTDFNAALQFAVELADSVNASIGDPEGIATLTPTTMLSESTVDTNWADVGVFSAASRCATCHQASDGAPGVMTYAGEDFSPYTGWQHDVMGNAFADPYFQAAVIDEARATPALEGDIEDSCLTCHAPMGRTYAHHSGDGLDPEGDYRLITALDQMHAREGVSCTACHQIVDDGSLGTDASFSGQYRISDSARLIFGPYTDPVIQAMVNNTQYTPALGDHTESSAFCATCHTLFTPTVSVDTGLPTGERFAEQTVYLEWKNSLFVSGGLEEAQCQDCHMPTPAEGYATQIATRPDGSTGPSAWPDRSPFNTHTLTGGNTHLLELLKHYRDLLGLEIATTIDGFDAKISETRTLLSAQTAQISIDPIAQIGSILEVPVRIGNLTGHKLPTSYPSRRMWLYLRVVDAEGGTVFESGRPDAQGHLSIDTDHLAAACLEIRKDPGVFDYTSCYEPHRDIIDTPVQVAVYESVLGDVNGLITYVLLHADRYLKDNRLPPRGYSRSEIPADGTTAIYGLATSDPDFHSEGGGTGNGEDTVHYKVDTSGRTGPFAIEARLLYQSVKPGFVYGLHADDDPRVARYKQMYEQVPPPVETLAAASAIH